MNAFFIQLLIQIQINKIVNILIMNKIKPGRPKTQFIIRGQKFKMNKSFKKELHHQDDAPLPHLNQIEVFTNGNQQESIEQFQQQSQELFKEIDAHGPDESIQNKNKLQVIQKQATKQIKESLQTYQKQELSLQMRQPYFQNQKFQDFQPHRRVFTPIINDLSPPFTPTSPSPVTGHRQIEKMIYPIQKPLKKQKNSNLVDIKQKMKQESRTFTENLPNVTSSQTCDKKFLKSLLNNSLLKKDHLTLETDSRVQTGASSHMFNNLTSHRQASSFIRSPLIEHRPKLIQSPVFSRQKQREKLQNIDKIRQQQRENVLTPPMSHTRPISFAQHLTVVDWSQTNSMESSRSRTGQIADSVAQSRNVSINASRNGTGMNLNTLLKREETTTHSNEFRPRVSVSTNINKALMPPQQTRATFQERFRPENSSRLVQPGNMPLQGHILKTLDSSRYGILNKNSRNPSHSKNLNPKNKSNQFDVSQFLRENEHEFERLNQSINILKSNSSDEDDLELALQSFSKDGAGTEFPSIWQESIKNPVNAPTGVTTETHNTPRENSPTLDDYQKKVDKPAANQAQPQAASLEINEVKSPKNSFLKSIDFTHLQTSKLMYTSTIPTPKQQSFKRVNRSLEKAKQVMVQQLKPIKQEKEEIEERTVIRRSRGGVHLKQNRRSIAPVDEPAAQEDKKIKTMSKYNFMNEMTPKPQLVDEMLDFLQYMRTRKLAEKHTFTKEQVKLLLNNTDHFIRMAKAQKENEALDKEQMIARFRIDYKGIKDRTDAQIRDIQDSLKEVYLGMIEKFHDNIMTEDFLEKNSVILEMMEENANDPQFKNQLREARNETKEFLNALIKSLNLRNIETSESDDDSYGTQQSMELDFKNSAYESQEHPNAMRKRTVMRVNQGGAETPQVNIDFDQYTGPKEVDKATGIERLRLRMKMMVQHSGNEQKGNKDYNTVSFNLKNLFDGRPTVIQKKTPGITIQEESDASYSETSSIVDTSYRNKKSRPSSKMGNATNLGQVKKFLNLNQALATPKPSSSLSPAGSMSKNKLSAKNASEKRMKSNDRKMSSKRISRMSVNVVTPSPPQKIGPAKKTKKLRKLGNNQTINFNCPGLQRFRELVAKHFLTIPLSKLEQLDYNNLNITFALLMAHFKKTLDQILPSPSRHSIYLKYQKMDRNLYQNLFLHNMLSNIPALKDQIAEEGFANKDRYQAIDCYKTDLNNLFGTYVEKLKFYKTAKQGKLNLQEESEVNSEAMLQYYNSCYKNREVIVPGFVTFEKNVMYMSQNSISHKQALALKQYLIFTNHLEDKRVHKLILDSCKIEDESLAEILKGIDYQSERNDYGQLERQYLSSFILSNSPLGIKSINVLAKLMTQLLELTINNVTNAPSLNKDNQLVLTDSLYEDGRRIMKLKLANFNLNDDQIVGNLCEMISLSRILQLFDVSWASLTVHQLEKITESLIERSKSIRHINFSYNQLQFDKVGADQVASRKVLANLYSLFEKAYVLCHVKLSGMRFGPKPLLDLCNKASKVRLLMSIHLNDNEINSDPELMQEILDIFGLRLEDLVELNRQKANQKLNFLQDSHELDMLRKNREVFIDYKKIIKTHLRSDSPIKKNLLKGLELTENQQRKLYKDHVIMGKHSKVIEQHRAINLSAVHQGIGRTNDSSVDPFVITRKVNYPEFIFNQKIKNDDVRGLRYFQKDHELQWKLSKTNECFICEKWKYTIIFFEKGMFSKNPELVEIFDEEFIDSMRQEFNKNYLKYKTLVPIICGSVVNRGFNQGIFDRKLKMMRASLFTLLSIAHSRDFVQNKLQSKFIKEAILKFNQFDSDNVMNEINIYDKIDGWNELLHDKCNQNELVDVTSVNQPNLLDGYIQYKDIYVYATFLPPGYHQMIIYDPQQERAFCKDIVVSLNQKDFYPEFPLQTGYEMPRTVQNVWRTWVEDSADDALKSFISDTQGEEFDVYRFIKDKSDANKCLDILRDNFEIYKIYHKECLAGSSKYPQIDWVSIWEQISKTQEDPLCKLDKKRKFVRAELELQFISATRFDDTAGLKSAMQRQELLDFLLRSAKVWTNKSYPRESISDHLLEFLNVYAKPVYDKSEIIKHRKTIRSSQRLNDLLFSNKKGLEVIFQEHKGKRGFTIESAQKLVRDLEDVCGVVSFRKVEEAFLYSMMTVLNEIRSLNKYNYLVFVEFLEMICRIAIAAIQEQDTIEWKVNLLLAAIYERRYAAEIWTRQKNPYVSLEQVDANNDNNFF